MRSWAHQRQTPVESATAGNRIPHGGCSFAHWRLERASVGEVPRGRRSCRGRHASSPEAGGAASPGRCRVPPGQCGRCKFSPGQHRSWRRMASPGWHRSQQHRALPGRRGSRGHRIAPVRHGSRRRWVSPGLQLAGSARGGAAGEIGN